MPQIQAVMNGFSHGAAYNPGFPVYKIILYAVWALVALFILIRGFFVYRTLGWSQERMEGRACRYHRRYQVS